LPSRIALLEKYVREYQADGLLINSVKSCNSFSAGQLLILREVERRTGVPGGFIETDLVDPRYFSAANVKNRIESYLQMIEQKRRNAEPRAVEKYSTALEPGHGCSAEASPNLRLIDTPSGRA
ncbi:MAG: 2-hydroxyacyl-CoA dehydratase, partial [Myxococcales bacterium]